MRTTLALLTFVLLGLAVLSACTGAPRFESEDPLSPWAKYGTEAGDAGDGAGGDAAGGE